MGTKQSGAAVPTMDASLGRAHATSVIGLGRAIELAVNRTGLTPTRFRALALVDAGITSGSVLASFLAVRPPTVTTVMAGLVDDGLVRRVRSVEDRRRVDHELTDAGREVLDRAHAAADEALARLLERLPETDRAAAVDGLTLWRHALDATRSRAGDAG